MKRNPLPPAEYLHQLFKYEKTTGRLRWKVKRAQMDIGSIAGARRGKGNCYLQVSIDRKLYRVHVVIWKMMTGIEPPHQVDHKDLGKSNNRWRNLRAATKSQNIANTGLSARNTSGYKGVTWSKVSQKWRAQIWKDGKQYFVGSFDDPARASAAYQSKGRELYGEYWRGI